MKSKKIKLYLHHNLVHEIVTKRTSKPWRFYLSLPFLLIFQGCYALGLGLVHAYGFLKFFTLKFLNFLREIKSGRLPWRNREFKLSFAVFGICVMTGALLMQAGIAISKGLSLQGQILGEASEGVEQLKSGQALLENQQAGLAQSQFIAALSQFQKAQSNLNTSGGILQSFFDLIPQKQDANAILEAVSDMTKAGIALTEAYQLINTVNFSAQGLEIGVNNSESLAIFANKLTEIQTLVGNANQKLQFVSINSIPADRRAQFLEARDTVALTHQTLENFVGVYDIFKQIISGDKKLLIFFQNNNELRPTGGFLGTFGKLGIKDGNIKTMVISSIYDLDGQLSEVIAPPQPLLAVNTRWFLRDSNWFFNFPDSAQKMISFYEKEGGETPDLVMAITPELVIEILKFTGPVAMPTYGVTLSADNFIETTQLVTSIQYDREQNKPKQMLADFFPLMLQKISSLDLTQKLKVLEIFQQSFPKKQVQLYSPDGELQKKIEEFHWAGKILESDRDYLAMVQINLGGTKTDQYIKNDLNLQTEIADTGEITNTITLQRKNTLLSSDSMVNTSFLKFYVPQGSSLIEASGFDQINLPYASTESAVDPDILALEQSSTRDLTTGTYTGIEHGKTTFSNWLVTRGGETKEITIKYTLPFKIKEVDRYSILFQRQSGTIPLKVRHIVAHPNHSPLWILGDYYTNHNDGLVTELTLENDIFRGLLLEHK